MGSQSDYWQTDDLVEAPGDMNCLNSIGKLIEEETGEVAPSGIDGELIKEFAEKFPHFPFYLYGHRVTNFKNQESNRLDEVSLRAQLIKKRQFVVRKLLKSIQKGGAWCW